MQMQFFHIDEFKCKQTGNNNMCPFFLEKLDELRYYCDMPFHITSGYRDPSHSIEAGKSVPGVHSKGIAADIHINNGAEGYKILEAAFRMGFRGIGIAKTFIHLDTRTSVPVIWTY